MSGAIFRIARVGLHHFEEPCLSGDRGSGTIFFCGCNLRCAFCQNFEISHGGKGVNITDDQLISAMLYLEKIGAHNINLVTPSIWADKLIDVLKRAKQYVKVPIVWNSSGYEDVKTLQKLKGLVDIYLPDFKYSDDAMAQEYSGVSGYYAAACAAIKEMHRQQPKNEFNENGIMKSGIIVRHLVLPNAIDNTAGVLRAIADIDKDIYVSLMGQYFPTSAVESHHTLGRRLTADEYDKATELFFDAGLKNGFSQELESAKEEYVPDFDLAALKNILGL